MLRMGVRGETIFRAPLLFELKVKSGFMKGLERPAPDYHRRLSYSLDRPWPPHVLRGCLDTCKAVANFPGLVKVLINDSQDGFEPRRSAKSCHFKCRLLSTAGMPSDEKNLRI